MRPQVLFELRHPTRVQRALLAPVWLISAFYGRLLRLRRALHRRGLLRSTRLPGAVVSVGSPLVGGSGKTPTAAWLARALRRRGHRVALASRGYRRRGREPVVVVSDGRHVRAGVDEAGDEALVLAAHAPGVPVIVAPQRSLAGWRAISEFGADVIVLDDGFSHLALARDLDLVVFDASGLGAGAVLPRGPLREPLAALRDVGAILVLDGELPEEDAERIRTAAPEARWFRGWRRPVALRDLRSGERFPAEAIRGERVGALCGIARPASFRRTLEELGAEVTDVRALPDHHRFRRGDLRRLAAGAPRWVTTEKDALKILPEWVPGVELLVLAIELEVERGGELVDLVERRLALLRSPPIPAGPG